MQDVNWTPQRLLEVSGGYWAACAIHTGLKLGVFTALGEESLSDVELAHRTQCDCRGLGMLLGALTALGLLHKDGQRYANTPFAAARLSRTAPDYMGHILLHHHHLMEAWARLPQAVCSGKPVRTSSSHTDEAEQRESFLMGMFNMAMLLAPHMARLLDLSGRQRLLDLGGGPGTYAVHFCLANPQLSAVVLDLPTTRPFAEQTIARFGMQERIAFHAGSFLEDPPPDRFDVAWLSHILHGEGPESGLTLLQQAVAALEPGGLLLIHEFILDDDRSGPLFPALFSLNMLLGTEHGQSYTGAEITELLHAAGARDVRRLKLDLPGPSGVIAATV